MLSIITKTNLHRGTVSLQLLVQLIKQSSNLVKDIWCIVSPHSRNWMREPYLGNLSFTSELVFPNSFGWFCQRIWAVSPEHSHIVAWFKISNWMSNIGFLNPTSHLYFWSTKSHLHPSKCPHFPSILNSTLHNMWFNTSCLLIGSNSDSSFNWLKNVLTQDLNLSEWLHQFKFTDDLLHQ